MGEDPPVVQMQTEELSEVFRQIKILKSIIVFCKLGGDSSGQVVQGQSGYVDYSSGGSAGGPSRIVKPVVVPGEPIVSKSFFVHAAPEESGPGVEIEERHQIVRPRKHYNIVFIKAPSAGGDTISNTNVNVIPEVINHKIDNVLYLIFSHL